MINSLDLIIFDCDGVIADSEVLSTRATAAALAEYGLDLTEKQVADLFLGKTLQAGLENIRTQFNRELPASFPARKMQLTEAVFRSDLRPVPGVVSLLDHLALPYCVASNSAHERLRFTFDATELTPYFFGRVYSADDVPCGKPAPDLFLHAARSQNTPPHRCLVIDDSPSGVRAAVAADMPVIGFLGGAHTYPALADQLRDAGATWIMHDYDEVRALLGPQYLKELA